MAFKYFDPITTEKNTIKRNGVIAINEEVPESPYLEYWNGETWIPLDNLDTIDGMAKLDNLATTLIARDWCIGPRLFTLKINNTPLLYLSKINHDTPIPSFISDQDSVPLVRSEIKTEEARNFDKIYENLLNVKAKNMNEEKDIDLECNYFEYLLSTRDLLNGSSVVDLISYTEHSMDYGSILNLNSLPRETSTIKLGISWTKNEKRKSENIMFDITDQDFSRVVSADVIVEYRDGCIRLFPASPEVTECIIHHCYLVYEELV